VATNDFGRMIHERLQALVSEVPADRRTLFAYPSEPSLYLILPAENPTKFSLMLPAYNTPEQFESVFAVLENGVDYVVITPLYASAGNDPLVQFLDGRYVLRERLSVIGPDVYTPIAARSESIRSSAARHIGDEPWTVGGR